MLAHSNVCLLSLFRKDLTSQGVNSIARGYLQLVKHQSTHLTKARKSLRSTLTSPDQDLEDLAQLYRNAAKICLTKRFLRPCLALLLLESPSPTASTLRISNGTSAATSASSPPHIALPVLLIPPGPTRLLRLQRASVGTASLGLTQTSRATWPTLSLSTPN